MCFAYNIIFRSLETSKRIECLLNDWWPVSKTLPKNRRFSTLALFSVNIFKLFLIGCLWVLVERENLEFSQAQNMCPVQWSSLDHDPGKGLNVRLHNICVLFFLRAPLIQNFERISLCWQRDVVQILSLFCTLSYRRFMVVFLTYDLKYDSSSTLESCYF